MDGLISINYEVAEEKIASLNKGIADMHTNIENIDKKTKEVVGVEWIGNDALVMQDSINNFLGAIRYQADSLEKITKNLIDYVNEMKANEAMFSQEQ